LRLTSKIALAIVIAGSVATISASNATAAPSSPAPLPDRLLSCILGRATNLETHREQKRSEVIYEGRHKFALYLPAGPARTTPPPDPIEPAEPVDSRTRIVADPDGLTNGIPRRFDRVVDMWPERVEMTTTIAEPLVNLIIVSDISADGQWANLFMTKATDVATLDLKNVYSGTCHVGPKPANAS